METTTALIDADIPIYRIVYTTENEHPSVAIYRMDELMHSILDEVGATNWYAYLSDATENNFRFKLVPSYKQNRTQPKPLHYEILKQHLINVWDAVVQEEQEADDALGIHQCNSEAPTIICSIDKDLKQIPGHHYNFVKKEFAYVSEQEGLHFFYKQLLIGDVTDNIFGVYGIGKAKADKILNPLMESSEEELFVTVQDIYRKWLQRLWADEDWGNFQEKQMNNIILLNGIQLKIRTKEEEIWTLPNSSTLKPEVVPTLS